MNSAVSVKITSDDKTNIEDRRCSTRTMTHIMDTPQVHPPCHTDRRGSQPHQTLPQLYSQMTTKVVKMQVGYYLNSKNYSSQTHHTCQGLQEVLTCQNGTPSPWNLPEGDYFGVWNPQPLGHVSLEPAKEMQSIKSSWDHIMN
jgi:hypothetical protein